MTIKTAQEFKEARQKLGLTQSELAATLGLGKNGGVTVRKWEMPEEANNARPPNPIACKVLEWLLSGELILKDQKQRR